MTGWAQRQAEEAEERQAYHEELEALVRNGQMFSVEDCSLLRQLLTLQHLEGKLNHDGLKIYERLCEIENSARP